MHDATSTAAPDRTMSSYEARHDDLLDAATDLRDELDPLPSVESVEVQDVPSPRVKLVLAAGNHSVPDEVREVLMGHDCDVRYPKIVPDDDGDARLALTIVPEIPHVPCGARTVRENGPSVVVTLTPDAMEESGFELGEKVNLNARPGEVCISTREEDEDE